MTLYDLIFLASLLVSVFIGVTRGGVREIVTLLALFGAIFISAWSKPWLVKTFHLESIGAYMAVIILFILVFFFIFYLGKSVSENLQKKTASNYFDRFLGFGFGFVRVLLLFGVFHLIFSAVTPIERQPVWFKTAKVYPLTAWSAKMVQHVLPQGLAIANKVAPTVAMTSKP